MSEFNDKVVAAWKAMTPEQHARVAEIRKQVEALTQELEGILKPVVEPDVWKQECDWASEQLWEGYSYGMDNGMDLLLTLYDSREGAGTA